LYPVQWSQRDRTGEITAGICRGERKTLPSQLENLFATNLQGMAYYNDFGSWLRERFPFKVQKISVDAGFSCPNRDGKIGTGGCSFCDNSTFNPAYCGRGGSVAEQLEAGKRFFRQKYPDMRYLAYFQADGVVGIVIGTRPDCVSAALLDYLAELARQTFVIVEYGIESANDETLRRINRGHTFECSRRAIAETADRGITVGGHVIIGLPGEDEAETLRQAQLISATKLNILKLHQLQIIKGTRLAREYLARPFRVYSVDEYISLISRYIQLLREDLVLERFTSQAPASLLLSPRWGLKNYEFTNLLKKRLEADGSWQGKALRQH